MDLSTGGSWKTVPGMTVSSIVGASKSSVFALPSTGHPYHWNVYAAYVSGTTSGTWEGCPGPGNVCTGGVTHTATLQVKFPHGIWGVKGTDAKPPAQQVNANSWDASPGCDPLFGDPADPECQDSATGSVLCSQSGENLASPPQPPAETESYDVVKWSGDFYPGPPVGPNSLGIYLNFAQCGFNHNGTCQYGQVAVCQTAEVDAIGWGNSADEAYAHALKQCSTGPWGQMNLYTPGVTGSCRTIGMPDRNVPIPAVCF
jgi:hypothetical protein